MECPICNKIYTQAWSLAKHVVLCEQKKCPQCGQHVKNLYGKFCSRSCLAKSHAIGYRNANWHGGYAKLRPNGYLLTYAPGHPRAYDNQVFEHILVAERALGKYLPPQAVIHHVD